MTGVQSNLTIKLIDDVSAPAGKITAAIKAAEAQVKALADQNLSGRLSQSMVRLGASAVEIQKVGSAWKQYADSQKLAANSSEWTKAQVSAVRTWESAQVSALRNVRREQETWSRQQRELRRESGMWSRHGALGFAASGAAGYVSAHSVMHGMRETVMAGARYQHEYTALQNAGRSPEEMREIVDGARRTAQEVPTSTLDENLRVINETTGAFGSLHHALENLSFMQKTASVLHAAAGDKIQEGAGELGNKLARFFEERQVASNTPQFQREAEGLVRAMAFTRGNFNPTEALNFAQQAKSALPNYSEHYLTRIAPSIITMMHGDRAGTAAKAFHSLILGRANDRKQAEEWVKYGLLDPKQTMMAAGHAVGWRAGAVKDTDLALSNPLAWFEQVVLPSMEAHGVDIHDRMALTKAFGTMFRNQNANQFADIHGQEASRIRLHKDDDLIGKAGDLDQIYNRNLSTDPTVAVTGLTAALNNLATTVSSPAMTAAAKAITYISSALGSLAGIAAEHPDTAMRLGVGAGAAALGGTGYLSYKLMTGFGLSTSAAALDASAAALTSAAVKLGGSGVVGGAAAAGGKKPSPFNLLAPWMLYEGGRSGMDWLFNSLPHPEYPKGYDPASELAKSPWERYQELLARNPGPKSEGPESGYKAPPFPLNDLLPLPDGAAAGQKIGESIRAGLAPELQGAVADAQAAARAIVGALSFSASPDITPRSVTTSREKGSSFDGLHGAYSDYGFGARR